MSVASAKIVITALGMTAAFHGLARGAAMTRAHGAKRSHASIIAVDNMAYDAAGCHDDAERIPAFTAERRTATPGIYRQMA